MLTHWLHSMKANDMCVIYLGYNSHSNYKLVFAANRDEFLDRPTNDLHKWSTDNPIYAGKDLKQGGTWFGVNEKKRFAVITNYRDFKNPSINGISRGLLVSDFLMDETPLEKYLDGIAQNSSKYDGFNLIGMDRDVLFYLSNKKDHYSILSSGIYGLSNSLLDTPWPKVAKGKKMFSDILQTTNNRDELHELLLKMLTDKQTFPYDMLPDTGIGPEKEKWLSSIFISGAEYGTRSSTVMTVDLTNTVKITEFNHQKQNKKDFELHWLD